MSFCIPSSQYISPFWNETVFALQQRCLAISETLIPYISINAVRTALVKHIILSPPVINGILMTILNGSRAVYQLHPGVHGNGQYAAFVILHFRFCFRI